MKTAFVFMLPRSGSSMVTGILHILGIDLGSPLKKADKYNVKGYFENENFLEIQRWLWAHGLDMLKTAPESKKWNIPRRLIDAYNQSFTGDFRATKMISEIADTLKPISGKIYVIVNLREPEAQTKSTRSFFLGKVKIDDVLLYRYYAERVYTAFNWALKHNCPLLVLDYDLILSRPRTQIERIVNFLGLPLEEKRIREAVNFVDRKLKHH